MPLDEPCGSPASLPIFEILQQMYTDSSQRFFDNLKGKISRQRHRRSDLTLNRLCCHQKLYVFGWILPWTLPQGIFPTPQPELGDKCLLGCYYASQNQFDEPTF